jgi:hypothetical protein
MDATTMITLRVLLTAAALCACAATTSAVAQDYGGRTLRYGNTSGWFYDGRGDDRDFPTNSYFPGNFAANPFGAMFGAAGIFESNPRRSPYPYPSQVVIGTAPADQIPCAGTYRSHDPAARTWVARGGVRRRC